MRMRKSVIFLVYLLLSSYLNVGFVGFSKVSAQGNLVFYDDFNDNSLDTAKWTEDMAGSGNTYSEENGEAHFTTYGHRTGSYTTEHAFLRSEIIQINGWDSVTFSGRWKFTDPGTAEMWFRVYDSDTGNYIGVRYISWTSTIAYDRPEGTVTESRNAPKEYTPFKLVLKRDGFEFWEGGELVKNFSTVGMKNASHFRIVIGGWDDSPKKSHIYFDRMEVSYEPNVLPTTVSPSGTTSETHTKTSPEARESTSDSTGKTCGPGVVALLAALIAAKRR
ncbi:hypothetical protein [Thermococcus sp. MAR1]|uniref:hypothetical protein n=1 Tax=Thermococcus sp. MAR1 TaxID=1638263 RepID=UPI0014391DB3|nr:hypothetical protein [Thermococcus sp. MAR1]NJE10617.1 hypothetical protein [Thermococcus sp. MAR1]